MTKKGGTRTGKGTSKFVCCECIEDSFLKRLVRQKGKEQRECNFCGAIARKGSAAPLQVVVEKVERLFGNSKRIRPCGELSADAESTLAVLRGFRLTRNEGLLSYVVRLLEGGRATKWWQVVPDVDPPEVGGGELLDWAWLNFEKVVTYESRFNFLTVRSPHFDIGKVLSGIGELVKSKKLVCRISEGHRIYRARVLGAADTWNPDDPKELGAPPRDKASAGRMNAAGIPYLYTAFDEETALNEVLPRDGCRPVNVVLAKFETTKQLCVLDLTDNVPRRPSAFDDKAPLPEDPMYFLAHFAADISLPVSKDSLEHIQYAPTQVISEYFAQVFAPDGPDFPKLDGLKFRSAKCFDGKNLVLFPQNRDFRKAQPLDARVRYVDWRVCQWPPR